MLGAMIVDNFESKTIFLRQEYEFVHFIDEISKTRDFLSHLDYLNFLRITFNQQLGIVPISAILYSSSQTLESIKLCCNRGNFSDAYLLLRKYRDDLFYYLYAIAVSDDLNRSAGQPNKMVSDASKNIVDWYNNRQKNLYIGDVLGYIGKSQLISKTVDKYDLRRSLVIIRDKLNNYAHANGRSYYNMTPGELTKGIKKTCKEFISDLNYLTFVFVFLLSLVKPAAIMSSDYVDYLDLGLTPPTGLDKLVAPFIKEYINDKKQLVDKNCVRYLSDMTEMDW